MGGIGKTQIVMEYVHIHHEEYSSVFWVDGTSEETATLGFRLVAQRLVDHYAAIAAYTKTDPGILQFPGMASIVDQDGQLCVEKEATARIVEAVKRWFSQKENQSWLLVLDNVDDLKSFDIRSFIPTSSHGTILITSRRKDCTRLGKGLEIEEMLESEGVLLLLRSAALDTLQVGAEGKFGTQYSATRSPANTIQIKR